MRAKEGQKEWSLRRPLTFLAFAWKLFGSPEHSASRIQSSLGHEVPVGHSHIGSAFSEEGRDIAREALGLFGRGEVSAAWHSCPLTDIVEAFRPLARRSALGDKVVGEDGDRRRHIDEIRGSELNPEPPVVEVVPHRRCDRFGSPEERHRG